ncbi:hypothetical protein PFICI_14834 [Pestalotiopsis fici W106-1]|uniref:Uncharacterized protein n=1 Tax=Pestalotiopsis fici (strain W106-1 / CGMCC3.15140) TaxID=1229662 RepID=W3WHI5_PESFW|nr:uncharacterized protein PFICI_14834 [Pestalotiopsis fici W106-1]ETS73229.1 hypothetical protein PFICI_14834 [Pestalotiopsis fici W106-1]
MLHHPIPSFSTAAQPAPPFPGHHLHTITHHIHIPQASKHDAYINNFINNISEPPRTDRDEANMADQGNQEAAREPSSPSENGRAEREVTEDREAGNNEQSAIDGDEDNGQGGSLGQGTGETLARDASGPSEVTDRALEIARRVRGLNPVNVVLFRVPREDFLARQQGAAQPTQQGAQGRA